MTTKKLDFSAQNSIRRIGVLTDDLTGAGDVALPFERAGLKTEIACFDGRKFPPQAQNKTRVWILDTETRNLSGRQASSRVLLALKAFKKWHAQFIYKKIDSTLRGPLVSELDLFIKSLLKNNHQKIAFIPAFPKAGRTTYKGYHYVDGRLIHRTAFSRDPISPIRQSNIFEVLKKKSSLKPVSLWIPDIQNQTDLRLAARRVFEGAAVYPRAAVGSSGFAEELVKFFQKKKGSQFPRKSLIRRKISKPVFVVMGSAHPRSQEQVRELKRRYGRCLRYWEWSEPIQKKTNGFVGIHLLSTPRKRFNPKTVLPKLGSQAERVRKTYSINRFMVTGGETGYCLCRLWKRFRWEIVDGIVPGVSLCRSLDRNKSAYYMVLKPGGFGENNIFISGVTALQKF